MIARMADGRDQWYRKKIIETVEKKGVAAWVVTPKYGL